MNERIDLVVPMVFVTDAEWRKKYAAVCAKHGKVADITDERVRTWDLERYFFRAIEKFMPWVHTIHLILDSETQVPEWLDASKVHIYANDDMIPVSPMKPEDFFVDGLPVIHCAEKYHDDLSSIFRTVCRRTLDMVAADAGKTFGNGILLKDGHSYAPMLLSALNACTEKFGSKMYHSCTPFRTSQNFIQYLYTYYMWLNGICVDGHHAHHYFSLGTADEKIQNIIRSGEGGVCCFNDSGNGDWHEKGRLVRTELNAILGENCKYEK